MLLLFDLFLEGLIFDEVRGVFSITHYMFFIFKLQSKCTKSLIESYVVPFLSVLFNNSYCLIKKLIQQQPKPYLTKWGRLYGSLDVHCAWLNTCLVIVTIMLPFCSLNICLCEDVHIILLCREYWIFMSYENIGYSWVNMLMQCVVVNASQFLRVKSLDKPVKDVIFSII